MNLIRAFFSVSGWTLASRALGLARDVVIAASFGAGALVDAFLAAFRLPNTLRRFTAEGALTQAFVPAYRRAQDESPQHAATLAGELLFLLAALLSAAAAAVMIFAPQVIAFVAPGLEEPAHAASMLQIVFPYIVFISMTALFAGMLNAAGRFHAAAAAPILLNVCLIAAALKLAPAMGVPVHALAWGVLAGGCAQLALVAFCVRRAGLWPRIRARAPDARMWSMLGRMGQSALGAGATQINLLINLAVASLLPAGSISWLYYADRLMELPAGLLGAALATVALPALASAGPEGAGQVLDRALRLAVILSLPAAAGLALLAEPIVHVLFARGAFDAEDAAMTSRAAAAYSAGVVGLVALRPLAAAFFARGDAATPAKVAVAALIFTQCLNGVFVFALQWGHAGIALAVGAAATFNAAVLFWILRRRGWYAPLHGWGRLLIAAIAALATMSVLLWSCAPAVMGLSGGSRAATLALLIAAAAAAYFAALRLGGVKTSDFRPPS